MTCLCAAVPKGTGNGVTSFVPYPYRQFLTVLQQHKTKYKLI